jgi:hypothetical protein
MRQAPIIPAIPAGSASPIKKAPAKAVATTVNNTKLSNEKSLPATGPGTPKGAKRTAMPNPVSPGMNPNLHSPNTRLPPLLCKIHHADFIYYCESCEVPLCGTCLVMGPHNNKMLHKVNNIIDVYMGRSLALNTRIGNTLLPKYEALNQLMQQLEFRVSEVQQTSGMVEQETNTEFMGIIDRLKSVEGQKQAILASQMSVLQMDIERINEIINEYNSLTKSDSDPRNFLNHFRMLRENVEFMIAKPFHQEVEVTPYDLPRELKQKRDALYRADTLAIEVEIRDKLATELADGMDLKNTKFAETLERQAKEEFGEWAKLVDSITNKIKAVKMVCYYCHQLMKPENINLPCDYNHEKDNPPKDLRNFKNIPSEGFHGTGFHFFSQANNIHIANLGREQEDLMIEKKRMKILGGNKITLEILLARIRRVSDEKFLNLPVVFEAYDKSQTGFVSGFHFDRIMSQTLEIENNDSEILKSFLDPLHHGEIDYGLFFRMTSEENFLDKFEKVHTA